MKSFTEYLMESKKTYAFKVKVAGDLEESFNTKLKGALDKFAIVNLGKGKRTPVQDVPLDFPTLKNTNVTIYDLEVSYPTTPEVLENYISQAASYPLHCIKVVTNNAPSEQYQAEMKEKSEPGKALLDDVELGGENAQDQVGEKHISSFLKDLASQAKGHYKAIADQPKEKADNMPEPGASVSPVGSKAQKGK